MNKKLANAIKNHEVEIAAIKKDTANKIKEIAKETGTNSSSVIDIAVDILQQAMGRQIIVRPQHKDWDLKINHFKKYNEIVDINPDKDGKED